MYHNEAMEKKILLTVLFLTVFNQVMASDTDEYFLKCGEIKANELRLACFDRAFKESKKKRSQGKSLTKQQTSQKNDSSWKFHEAIDQFSDRKMLYLRTVNDTAQFSVSCRDDSAELGMSLNWGSYGGSGDYVRVSLKVDAQKPDSSEWAMWNEGKGATHMHESSEDFDRIISELKVGKTLHTRVWPEYLQPIDHSFIIAGFERAFKNFETQCLLIHKK
jgi:hypothetical protein